MFNGWCYPHVVQGISKSEDRYPNECIVIQTHLLLYIIPDDDFIDVCYSHFLYWCHLLFVVLLTKNKLNGYSYSDYSLGYMQFIR